MVYIYLCVSILIFLSLKYCIKTVDYIKRLALLIFLFINTGLIYLILDFKFLGLTYIIVYVGAISILFIFVVKMTGNNRSPLNIKSKGVRLDLILFITLAMAYLSTVSVDNNEAQYIYNYFITDYETDFVSFTDIESFGYILYLGYPLIILLIGILLWCILIGILKISQK